MFLARGRAMRALPGPSVMPDRVLNAMHRAAPDIYGTELITMTDTVLADLSRLAQTAGHAVTYIANGHGAWEAANANLFLPGDRVLVLATGRFGPGWAETARRMGMEAEILDFGFEAPADPDRLEDRLRADTGHDIRAVLTVQTDTASSVRNDVPALRQAIDAVGHPALYAVDCIASLACEPFRMDDWGVDVMVAACQKGLMTPPGLAFTFHNARAHDGRVACPSPYWDWGPRVAPELFYQRFGGTPPTHHLYGLREALNMVLNEEGLDAVWRRHAIFAAAVWAAVECWAAGGDLALNVPDPAARSHAVTTIRTAPGDGRRLQDWCASTTGLSLGIGMVPPGFDSSAYFRIGHMGHLDPPMLLGTLATIEAGLLALDIPHGPGGVVAAAGRIAEAASGAQIAGP
jgi:alanine-glyoxylate transaminase/serine-glyoxylate transaminase/serine-pyruvate transaminase